MVLPQSTRVKGFRIGQRVFEAGLQREGKGPGTDSIFGVKKVRQEDTELASPYEPPM